MSNMSYCRFQNTEIDLIDCINALEGEVDLSNDELNSLISMVSLCQKFVDNFSNSRLYQSELYEDVEA